MTNLLRALPALVAALAFAGSAHAEDSLSSSSSASSSNATSRGLELTAGMGAGGLETGNDWAYGGYSMGLSALYFGESGHGLGVRATMSSNLVLWSGNESNAVDALYTFRPFQAHGTFSVVPSFFVGGGWLSAARHEGGLFTEPRVSYASALSATGGAAVDLHIKHFVIGLEGSARTALAGDDDLRRAVGWNAMLHLGGEIDF